MSRITCLNWLIEAGLPPLGNQLHPASDRSRRIEAAVRTALEHLPESDRELIRLFYFQGVSLVDIASQSGQSYYRLVGQLRRAAQRLQRLLAPFVKDEFGIATPVPPDCPICQSDFREQIDRLIDRQPAANTWRPVLRKLRRRYNLSGLSVSALIGHARNHRELKLPLETERRNESE